MNEEKLARMANQVALFFAAEPDPAAGAAAVASHLRRFWEPRMRAQLLRAFEQRGGEGLHPLVRQALETHGEMLLQPTPRNPAPA